MSFKITNEKGLFHSLNDRPVLTVETHKALMEKLIPTLEDEKKKQEWMEVLTLIGKLPTGTSYSELNSYDPEYATITGYKHRLSNNTNKEVRRGSVKVYLWKDLAMASAKSDKGIEESSVEELGWGTVKLIAQKIATLAEIYQFLNLFDLAADLKSSAAKMKQKEKKITFTPYNPTADLVSSKAFAVFAAYKSYYGPTEGFVDASGNLGPITRARLFESEAAAKRVGNRYAQGAWHPVEINMTLSKICAVEGSIPNNTLQGAVAAKEAQELNRILEEAGIERLREKLAEMEALAGVKEEPPTETTKRRSL